MLIFLGKTEKQYILNVYLPKGKSENKMEHGKISQSRSENE